MEYIKNLTLYQQIGIAISLVIIIVSILYRKSIAAYFSRDKSENFESTNKNGVVFNLFHTTWCGYCKRFMPDWLEFKNQLKDNKTISFVEIDCDEHADLAKQYGVKSYPTLILTVNGKNIEYTGNRTKEDLEAFVKTHI